MTALFSTTGLIAFLAFMLLFTQWVMGHYSPISNTLLKYGDNAESKLQWEMLKNFFGWSLPLISLVLGHWFGNRLQERHDEPMYVEDVSLYQ